MAPKKARKAATSSTEPGDGANGIPDGKSRGAGKTPNTSSDSLTTSPKKRKAHETAAKEPSKASRRSARGAPTNTIEPLKLINFLLSPEALPLCRPKDETSDLESRGKDTRTYSTGSFTPFEELVCALILSRPIGHMLGLRSIRTLLNDPHNMSTPRAIHTAGKEGCRAALDEARTQHRQKTAEELVLLADALGEHFGRDGDDTNLQKLRDDCGKDAQKERDLLKKHVKGMAKTGIDIFARRIQGVWEEWYPFIDDKTVGALEKLGLEGNEQALVELLDKHWKDISTSEFEGDDDQKRRQVFVRILGQALGAELEGNIDEVRKAVS